MLQKHPSKNPLRGLIPGSNILLHRCRRYATEVKPGSVGNAGRIWASTPQNRTGSYAETLKTSKTS